jgi:hypothetical protein
LAPFGHPAPVVVKIVLPHRVVLPPGGQRREVIVRLVDVERTEALRVLLLGEGSVLQDHGTVGLLDETHGGGTAAHR